MAHSYTEDSAGNKSSKRVTGIPLTILGGIMTIIVFGAGLLHPEATYKTSIEIALAVLGLGVGELTIGCVFEKFKKS